MSDKGLSSKQKVEFTQAVESLSSLFGDEELAKHLAERIRIFQGNFDVLESALGALVIGRVAGWRVLKLLHSHKTYKRYEQVLGLEFAGTFPWSGEYVTPERGVYSRKSVALRVADKLGDFWQVVQRSGDIPKKEAESV